MPTGSEETESDGAADGTGTADDKRTRNTPDTRPDRLLADQPFSEMSWIGVLDPFLSPSPVSYADRSPEAGYSPVEQWW